MLYQCTQNRSPLKKCVMERCLGSADNKGESVFIKKQTGDASLLFAEIQKFGKECLTFCKSRVNLIGGRS